MKAEYDAVLCLLQALPLVELPLMRHLAGRACHLLEALSHIILLSLRKVKKTRDKIDGHTLLDMVELPGSRFQGKALFL